MTWTHSSLRISSRSAGGESNNSPRNTARAERFLSWRHLGGTPTEYPPDLEERILSLRDDLGLDAVAVAHVLRVRDDLTIDNNVVYKILTEYEHVSENENKQGRRRPWVRFERDYSLVTVHVDWYQNDRGQWCLAVEDDASRKVLEMIEDESPSAGRSVSMLDEVRDNYASHGEILEVITDHGSEFVNTHQDERPCLDHEFERHLDDNDIIHTLCKVGRCRVLN